MPIKKVKHNDKIYKIITDDDISHLRLIITRRTSGRLSPIVYLPDGKFQTLNKYLFGFATDHKNGNDLDFRRENVEKFTMQKYNLTKRTYKTIYRGIVKRKNDYAVSVFHNNKRIRVGTFPTLEKAIKSRKEYQKKMGQI